MIARNWTDRYKKCPTCQARIPRLTEFCRHCGLYMPVSFPHNPVVPGEARKVMRKMAEEPPAPRPERFDITGRYLVIVGREHRELYAYLKAAFAGEPGVQVIQERRLADRRRKPTDPPLDRRRVERRRRPGDPELRKFGVAVVRTV
jgi:hypothetical protein